MNIIFLFFSIIASQSFLLFSDLFQETKQARAGRPSALGLYAYVYIFLCYLSFRIKALSSKGYSAAHAKSEEGSLESRKRNKQKKFSFFIKSKSSQPYVSRLPIPMHITLMLMEKFHFPLSYVHVCFRGDKTLILQGELFMYICLGGV